MTSGEVAKRKVRRDLTRRYGLQVWPNTPPRERRSWTLKSWPDLISSNEPHKTEVIHAEFSIDNFFLADPIVTPLNHTFPSGSGGSWAKTDKSVTLPVVEGKVETPPGICRFSSLRDADPATSKAQR